MYLGLNIFEQVLFTLLIPLIIYKDWGLKQVSIDSDENSQPFSIRKICGLNQKWRKAIFKPLKNHKISIETSQFMLNL